MEEEARMVAWFVLVVVLSVILGWIVYLLADWEDRELQHDGGELPLGNDTLVAHEPSVHR